jgi:hypothetical protein
VRPRQAGSIAWRERRIRTFRGSRRRPRERLPAGPASRLQDKDLTASKKLEPLSEKMEIRVAAASGQVAKPLVLLNIT